MVEKDTVYQGKIKQGGMFHFKDLYSFLYDWLREEGYDLFERNYTEKIKGDSKEIGIEWIAMRKISDYFRYVIKINWLIVGMKDVEVKREDKKIKMNTGLIEIKFRGILEKDYEHRWENHPFWKFLRGIYEKYIIRSRIEDYEDRLIEEVLELIEQCKSFLVLEAKSFS